MPDSALSNLSVVEYSQNIMGAMCAKAFADQGANVIKIEPPHGDPLRQVGPFPEDIPHPEKSGHFLYLNANKRGVTLDLTSSEGSEKLNSLIRLADVFITDLAPRYSSELGLEYEKLEAINPRLIAAYVTYFGQTGPYRDFEGSDLIAWHMGGMGYETPSFYVTDAENEPPLRGGGKHAEYLAGWTAAAAAMTAIFHRDALGTGQMVDVSAMEAVSNHIRTNFAIYSYDITAVPESRHKPFFPWIWPCKDGHVSISFVLDHWWMSLKELMGHPEWAQNNEFDSMNGRRANRERIEEKVSEWLATKSRRELYGLMQSRSVPCFPVQSTEEVLSTEHFRSRNYFVEQNHSVAGKVTHPGIPVRLKHSLLNLASPAPVLGQHNDEVFAEIENAVVPNVNPNPPNGEATQPLRGIRVIDFGWILSVPHCTAWLGSLGAQVIRVESQRRLEPGRLGFSATADGVPGVNRSANWNGLNYSKLDVTLNLSKPESVELIKELVSVSDVVVENFAPGVLKRLGLGYATLKQIKPDLVMLSGSTLGVTGPESSAMGWGPNVSSYAGMPYVSGYADGPPVNMGGNWPDYLVGIIMVFSLLGALNYRNRTGEGQYIDISMAEVVASAIPEAFIEFSMNKRHMKRIGNHDPNMAPHNVYRCAGVDQWVAIAVRNDDEWNRFCKAVGRANWLEDMRFNSLENRKRNEDELDELVGKWSLQFSPKEAADVLQSAGIAAGPVMNVMELMDDPHLNERGFIVEMDHLEVGKRKVAGLPIKLSAVPDPAYSPAPLLGQHNGMVLGELLGIIPQKMRSLIDRKVVY